MLAKGNIQHSTLRMVTLELRKQNYSQVHIILSRVGRRVKKILEVLTNRVQLTVCEAVILEVI